MSGNGIWMTVGLTVSPDGCHDNPGNKNEGKVSPRVLTVDNARYICMLLMSFMMALCV
jgi:hypothetical protein